MNGTTIHNSINLGRGHRFRGKVAIAEQRDLFRCRLNDAVYDEIALYGFGHHHRSASQILVAQGPQRDDAAAAEGDQSHTKLRTLINTIVEGFATSPEGIDQLRKRSVMVQAAILSVDLPQDVDEAVRGAYLSICNENGDDMTPVAVRSSAAGEDSRKKAFAGLQDTYLNMVGPAKVVEAYHWDCASAYNLRSMTYRREAILDAIDHGELTSPEEVDNRFRVFFVHYDDYAHSWAKQVYAALLGHTPTVDEIDEAISAGHNAHASMRRTTDADRDRDCSLDMAVSYGLDCTSEEERREDYYSVRGLK